MIINSDFNKGLSNRFSLLKQPPGTYVNARNIVLDPQGTVRSELGTLAINSDLSLLTNGKVLGYTSINDTIILLVTSDEGSSIFNLTTNQYILKTGTHDSLITDDLLNFTEDIDVVSRTNYKGDIILYFVDSINTPKRVNCSDTYASIEEVKSKTSLFLLPNLPRVSNLEVKTTGSLPTGLYSFAARLVTASGNATTFSTISDPIPIVDENNYVGEVNVDGADPQTSSNKSIEISLSDIDTTYDYVEVAAITYNGSTNITTATVVLKKKITTSSMTLSYYSIDQLVEELVVDSLIEEATEYETAKHIVQKDNFLFLSNLTVKDTSQVDSLMETVANAITVHYTVKKEVQEAASLIDTAELVKSDATIVDWSLSESYPTNTVRLKPNSGGGFNNYKNPDYTFRYKGYQRDEVYSFAIVPIFKGGIKGFAYHIPGNTANYSTISSLGTDATADKRLRGWKNDDGTYHHRMPSASVVPIMDYSTSPVQVWINILGLEFKNINFPTELTSILEGFTIVRQRRNNPGDGIVVAQGIARRLIEKANTDLLFTPFAGRTKIEKLTGVVTDYTLDSKNNAEYNFFQFITPDHIHGLLTDSDIGLINSYKQTERRLLIKAADNGSESNSGTFDSVTSYGTYYNTLRNMKAGEGYSGYVNIPITIEPASTKIIKPFKTSNVTPITLSNGKSIKSCASTGGIILKGTQTIPVDNDIYTYNSSTTCQTYRYYASGIHVCYQRSAQETSAIYTTYNLQGNVYGYLSDATYIKVQEIFFDDNPGTSIQVYGGDTFVGRYNFNISEEQEISGAKTATNIDVWLETKGNYSFRHYNETEINGTTITEGTLPYAPKYKILRDTDPVTSGILGIWDYDSSYGFANGYNKQYHFENVVNQYYPKDDTFSVVSNFPNRTIYSLQAFEEEQSDAYRTFLVNNYHDIPKETGEITNTFVYNNILYLHTSHSLWRSFVNEKTFVNTSTGQTVLGNGGLFPIPSQQLYTQEGGYAGSSAKYGCVNTPYGRVFIDNHQKLVFLLVGSEDLKEISNPYMNNYFQSIINNAVNYQAGYDPLNKRAILQLGTESISFSFEKQAWASYHDYVPDKFIIKDNKLLITSGTDIAELGTGIVNTYFGSHYDTQLDLALNDNYSITKVFRNIKWIQDYKDDIFSQIVLETESYTTGNVTPVLVDSFISEQEFLPLGSQHVNLIGGEYRMTIPPDHSSVNELFTPSIKGKYGLLKLTYAGITNPLVLQHIQTEYLNVAE